jgi:hypothetical protein
LRGFLAHAFSRSRPAAGLPRGAVRYLRHAKPPVHVNDMCCISNIEERALARAFTDVFNMSQRDIESCSDSIASISRCSAAEARAKGVADILMSGGVVRPRDRIVGVALRLNEMESSCIVSALDSGADV